MGSGQREQRGTAESAVGAGAAGLVGSKKGGQWKREISGNGGAVGHGGSRGQERPGRGRGQWEAEEEERWGGWGDREAGGGRGRESGRVLEGAKRPFGCERSEPSFGTRAKRG